MPKQTILARVDQALERQLHEEFPSCSFSSKLFMSGGPLDRPKPDQLCWKVERGPFFYEMRADPKYGLPWGVYGRLIQIWIDTQIIRDTEKNWNSALQEIEMESVGGGILKGKLKLSLGSSLSEWLTRLGLDTGGKTMRAVADNWERMASIKLAGGQTPASGRYIRAVSEDMMGFFSELGNDAFPLCLYTSFWWKANRRHIQDEASLWDSFIILNPIYKNFVNKFRAIPMDDAVLAVVRESPLAIDFYRWLRHRQHSGQPFSVDLNQLLLEFGIHAANPTRYKELLKLYLERIQAVWKVEARFTDGNRGTPAKFLLGM